MTCYKQKEINTNVLPNELLEKEEGGQLRERGSRAHGGGLGGRAVAVKPRAPRRVSPAQENMQRMKEKN